MLGRIPTSDASLVMAQTGTKLPLQSAPFRAPLEAPPASLCYTAASPARNAFLVAILVMDWGCQTFFFRDRDRVSVPPPLVFFGHQSVKDTKIPQTVVLMIRGCLLAVGVSVNGIMPVWREKISRGTVREFNKIPAVCEKRQRHGLRGLITISFWFRQGKP